MKHSRPTQRQRVLDYITDFGSITPYEAMKDLGIMRLASRVTELKKLGYPIVGEFIPVKNRYGETSRVKRYSLGGDKQ